MEALRSFHLIFYRFSILNELETRKVRTSIFKQTQFSETTHKTNCNCKKIEVKSTGLANKLQKNSMGIFVRHSRKDGITSYRNGKDALLSGGPNKHWIVCFILIYLLKCVI